MLNEFFMKHARVQMPIDAVIGINYVCNSRCVMCDIWKVKKFPELPPEEYRKLPNTLRDINISGGETFLRKDIVDVIRVIHETVPKARMVISTNGFMPALIESQMKKILAVNPDIGVAISLDGVGEMHEQVRRIPDGYNKCIETLERLQSLGMKNLRFGFTIIPENVEHMSKVYDDAMKRGIQFTHSFAQGSDNYFGGAHINNDPDLSELKKQYRHVISHELKSWNLKRWLRAYFSYSLYNFINTKHQLLNNDPGTKFFFLHSNGVVYPSVVNNHEMGNIQDVSSWDDLWYSAKADEARQNVQKDAHQAWMICTARSAIKQHPFRVASWIVKNKFGVIELE